MGRQSVSGTSLQCGAPDIIHDVVKQLPADPRTCTNLRTPLLCPQAGEPATLDAFKAQFDGVTFSKGLEIVFSQHGSKLTTQVQGMQAHNARIYASVVVRMARCLVRVLSCCGSSCCKAAVARPCLHPTRLCTQPLELHARLTNMHPSVLWFTDRWHQGGGAPLPGAQQRAV